MTNGRPYHRPDVAWTAPGVATPPLALRKLDALQQIAACTAVAAEGWQHTGNETVYQWGFAEGVAAVLAWLAGEPPTAELVLLLELDEEGR